MKLMRKFLSLFVGISLSVSHLAYSSEPVYDEDSQYAHHEERSTEHLGYGASYGSHSTISASMIGWGILFAAAIGVIATTVHQSEAPHSTSTSSK